MRQRRRIRGVLFGSAEDRERGGRGGYASGPGPRARGGSIQNIRLGRQFRAVKLQGLQRPGENEHPFDARKPVNRKGLRSHL